MVIVTNGEFDGWMIPRKKDVKCIKVMHVIINDLLLSSLSPYKLYEDFL